MTWRRAWIAMALGLFVFDGCTYRLGGTDESEAPLITAVEPPVGSNAEDVRAVVVGLHFERVLVRDLTDERGVRYNDQFRVTVGGTDARNVVRVDDEHLEIIIPAGLPEGPQDVVVDAPNGQSAQKEKAYYATSSSAPVITAVTPPAAISDAPQNLDVAGDRFRDGTQIFIVPNGEVVEAPMQAPLAELPATTQTSTLRRVVLPAGQARGTYTVVAKNPDGQRGLLRDGLQVLAPASLSLTLSAPTQVSTGQSFSVSAEVGNAGGSAALDVGLAAPVTAGDGAATAAAAVPASANIPAAGGRVSYAFTAVATAKRTLRFSTQAVGHNEYSGKGIASPTASTGAIVIQDAAQLSVSFATPATVAVGESATITVTVHNDGEATAQSVTPAVTGMGSSSATLVSGPTPSAANISGGGSQMFTSVYSMSSAGSVTFQGTASGRDGNSGQTVTSPLATSSAVEVQ